MPAIPTVSDAAGFAILSGPRSTAARTFPAATREPGDLAHWRTVVDYKSALASAPVSLIVPEVEREAAAGRKPRREYAVPKGRWNRRKDFPAFAVQRTEHMV